jgi:hypothetical protein
VEVDAQDLEPGLFHRLLSSSVRAKVISCMLETWARYL